MSSNSSEEETKHEEETQIFMFIYETDGKYYAKLDDIKKKEGQSVLILPVYFEGYIGNMYTEEVRYSERDKKYIQIPSEDDGSWLDVIYGSPDSIDPMDLDEVVLYDGHFYHCDGDLAYHLTYGMIDRIAII